jgi:isocitrate dehydrogenase (NAD+)
MAHRITVIPGDGIGPEIMDATVRVLEATGVAFDFEYQEAGLDAQQKYGNVLPEDVLASVRRNKTAIKGPITTPRGGGFRSVNVALRKMLDLYACLRPAKSYAGVRSRYENIDLVIVRENHEDLYAGVEFEKGDPAIQKIGALTDAAGMGRIREDAGLSLKIISETGTTRVARFAFAYAQRYGRKKVTAVAKDNILKFTDGLFFKTAKKVSEGYSDIEYQEVLVDNMAMQLVQKPENYDVLLLPNLYGDVLSDLCAGLVGGLGVAPGANLGDEIALFEPVHGSAPKYAGQNKVNPIALMLSGVMMLRHIGEIDAADRMEKGIATVIAEGKSVTYDMKPSPDDPTAVGTSQVADAIIEKMKAA